MVIQNRKILATLLPPPDITTSNATAAPTGSAGPAPKATSALVQNTGRHMIVILEVKPDEAEIMRWAQREEKTDPQNYIDLSLALRSDKDNDLPERQHAGHHLQDARGQVRRPAARPACRPAARHRPGRLVVKRSAGSRRSERREAESIGLSRQLEATEFDD